MLAWPSQPRSPAPRDAPVVWKLDRLGRDLRHLVSIVRDLTERGVGLRVLTGQCAAIDTTTASGKLVFGIFAALAEFERELISERTTAGLTAARVRGRHGGRPCKMPPPISGLPWPPWASPEQKSATSAPNSVSLDRPSACTSYPPGELRPDAKSSSPDERIGKGADGVLKSAARTTDPLRPRRRWSGGRIRTSPGDRIIA
ncbi:recombinase family protein [Pseudarthrobacter sp. So.54]